MTNKIIPVLIDEDNSKLETILERIAETLGTATKSDLPLPTRLQKDNIRKACGKLSILPCSFSPGYLLHQDRNLFAIFSLEDRYCSGSDCDFDGNVHDFYSSRWIDSVACLTTASEVFGIIKGVYFENEAGQERLPKKAIRRLCKAEDLKEKLEGIAHNQGSERISDILMGLSTDYDEFDPFSSYANFIYFNVEQKLQKLQERLRQERTKKREGTKRAKDLIARL